MLSDGRNQGTAFPVSVHEADIALVARGAGRLDGALRPKVAVDGWRLGANGVPAILFSVVPRSAGVSGWVDRESSQSEDSNTVGRAGCDREVHTDE
jgi:hypothetical protein